MAVAPIIWNGPLSASFQPSLPITISADKLVLDFDITVGGRTPLTVQWYPEFAEGDVAPSSGAARWYREVAEEDIGNGDVRMPLSIRRFTTNGTDAGLPPGTYRVSVQLKRTHMFARIQIQGDGCTVTVRAPLSELAA